MLKGDKMSTPYFTLANQTPGNGAQSSSSTQASTSKSNGNFSIKESALSILNSSGNGGIAGSSGQKVTRRVAHEICEKRKLEEQEFELSKRVKTEGDVNETVIKQLVKEVESEMADNENGVRIFSLVNVVAE